MTGYGRGKSRAKSGEITAEVRSVNHRFLEVTVRLPRALSGYEGEVEKLVRKHLRRGHVYVTVNMDAFALEGTFKVNSTLIAKVYRELERVAEREGIPGKVDIATVLSLPEVVSVISEPHDARVLWPRAKEAVERALRECVAMRRKEARELVKDISKRVKRIAQIVDRIGRKAPELSRKAFKRARERVKKLLEGTAAFDESRWATELAILADRSDITEELIRIKSHLAQFQSVLKKGGEVSKRLTFLLQEIHREATTMGNKSPDAKVIEMCLVIKEEVEKVREQAQNLE